MTTTQRAVLFLSLALAAFAVAATAEPPSDEPPFVHELFPPDLIMEHQRDLQLTEEQRANITRAVQETQARVVELRWQMTDAAQGLAELLSAETVDEEAALRQVSAVMDVEEQVKTSHMRMLIRIKNQLTPEQQRQLRAVRAQGAGPR